MIRLSAISVFSLLLLTTVPPKAEGQNGYHFSQSVNYDSLDPFGQNYNLEPTLDAPTVEYVEPYNANTSFDFRGTPLPHIKAQLGLGLFEPSWSDESFKTLVPAAAAPAFGFTGKGRADDFTYEPSLTINFNVEDVSFFGGKTAFMYSKLELNGELNEEAVMGGPTPAPAFNTSSTINMEEYRFQIAEYTIPLMHDGSREYSDGNLRRAQIWDVPQVTFLLDVSYRDFLQKYDSTVTNGTDQSTVHAEAHFQGLGIAPTAKFRFPFGDPLTLQDKEYNRYLVDTRIIEETIARFALFFNAYGNFSVGENDRFSSLNTNVTTPGAMNVMSQNRLDRTEFVATGGFDVGLNWNTVVKNTDGPDTLFTAVIAFTLESSSNIGPINPQGTSPGANDFLLYGFLVGGGARY